MLLPIIGITTKGTPKYQILIYSLINGITIGSAPSILKTGSIVSKPMVDAIIANVKPSSRLSVDSSLTASWSFSPKALDIITEAPIPSPILRLLSIRTTGNVKVSAAIWLVPSFPTKKVSAKLKATRPKIPNIMGMVSCLRWDFISPVVKSCLAMNAPLCLLQMQ